MLKYILKFLTIFWCVALLAMAIAYFAQKVSFFPHGLFQNHPIFPDHPIVAIDYAFAVLLLVLIPFVFKNHRIGMIASAVLFVLCGFDLIWVLIVMGDSRGWPGASVAIFGIIFFTVKQIESRKRKQIG
jgi:hypothetical protein